MRYDENVQRACPYNPSGSHCLKPKTCLCRQTYKAIPSGLDKTTSERWSSIIGEDEVTEARQAAADIIRTQLTTQAKPNQTTSCDIRLDYDKARPQNEWSEKDIIAMAFVVEFPFGITSFRTLRHSPIDDIIQWTCHLCYLCYQLDETGKLKHAFQANPVFVLYIRNRAHRHAINNGLKFFLQRTTKQLKRKFPLWREGITNAEFKNWPKTELLKFHQYVTSNMECKPGDLADLRNFKKTITSCTLAHGTPTDYVTTSWNDPNVWDLHRPQILPYKEDPISNQNSSDSLPQLKVKPMIDEIGMTSRKPEKKTSEQESTANKHNPQIHNKQERYTMLHENPATVCMWFFIRQFVNMQVMRQCSFPVAYEEWFARKFEFQDRGSVHEHAGKALTFLWIKADAKTRKKDINDLTTDDYEAVTCRTDKLSMYCESGMVREIMMGRILFRIQHYLSQEDTPEEVKPKLEKLKLLFTENKQWMKCKCEEACPKNCANQELRDLVQSVRTSGNKPKQQTTRPRQNTKNKEKPPEQNSQGDEYKDDTFAGFKHISVTYKDPKLNELCSWLDDDLEKTEELQNMFDSYRDWILLGRHAEKMLCAFVDARIHSWDNTNDNYPGQIAGSGAYRHGRADTANRITRLRFKEPQKAIDPTLYEDCHRLHVSTSQLHECG